MSFADQERIKELLGNPESEDIDKKISSIVDIVEERLMNLLGNIPVPEELFYIVEEVSVIRFNRIGSEGMTSHTVDGENISFINDDFSPYIKDIESWLSYNNSSKKGKVRFI